MSYEAVKRLFCHHSFRDRARSSLQSKRDRRLPPSEGEAFMRTLFMQAASRTRKIWILRFSWNLHVPKIQPPEPGDISCSTFPEFPTIRSINPHEWNSQATDSQWFTISNFWLAEELSNFLSSQPELIHCWTKISEDIKCISTLRDWFPLECYQ